jgi:MacB-like periplasmic core domain
MTAALAVGCKAILRLARRIVPADSREVWDQAWQSDYWHWLHKAEAHKSSDGRSALIAHTADATRAAVSAAFGSPENIHRREYITGHPWFPIAALALALVGVVVWSAGVPETLRLLSPAKLPVADRLVLLSQSRPYLGARRGFSTREAEVIAARAQTLAGIARHQWFTATVAGQGQSTKRPASNVGPGFFRVLGVSPSIGYLPAKDDEFAVSSEYWRSELHSDRSAIGNEFRVHGRKLRLVGVLPADFRFLSPIDIWTAQSFDAPLPADPRLLRWANLKGVVARVKPGVPLAAVEKEIRAIQDSRNMGHYTYQVHAAPFEGFANRAANIYGVGLLVFLLVAIAGVGTAFGRDVRSGSVWNGAARYWGLLLAKLVLSLVLCFLFVMENTGVNRQGIMGGVWFGRDLFAMWLFLIGSVVLGYWAWRDQKSRCRVCLNRLRDPIRIGIPGQVLLETTGLELMCSKGHGIIYSPESVLGSEMSDHWLGLEDLEADPAAEPAGK